MAKSIFRDYRVSFTNGIKGIEAIFSITLVNRVIGWSHDVTWAVLM